MKKFFTILVTLFVLLFNLAVTPVANTVKAAEENFTETKVTIDDGISATINQPKDAKSVPAVILLHGFASTKDEVGDMYKRLAAALAAKGIASVRFDFHGWGESKGDMADTTVQGQVDDTKVAYEYMAKLPFVDPKRLGVVGFSLGGGIAIISGSQNPEWYKSMCLWSSTGDLKADFIDELKQENFEKAAKEGKVEIDLGWRKVTLKDSFFKSLDTYNIKEIIGKYPGAFLAVAGDQDFSAGYVKFFIDTVKGGPKESYVVKGGDHIYGVLGDDQAMANDVINKTAEWFSKTL